MSLRYKILILFSLAIILPALLLSFILSSISKKVLRKSIIAQQQEIIHRVGDKINNQIERHTELLSLLANRTDLLQKQQYSFIKDIFEKGTAFSEIMFLNSKGKEEWKYVLKKIQQSPTNKRDDISYQDEKTDRKVIITKDNNLIERSKRPEFINLRSDSVYISPVYFTPQRHPFLLLSLPVRDNKKDGVLLAKVDLDQTWQWISEIKIGEQGYAFVVDNKGMLIAYPEPERVWAHSNFSGHPVVSDFLKAYPNFQKKEIWNEYLDERGRKVLALYEYLPKLNWAVVTQIPVDEVYRPVVKMIKNIFFWSIFWTCLFLFLGIRFIDRIIMPLEKLQLGAKKISQGNLDISLDIRTGDEIEVLSKSFETMAFSLKQLEQMKQDLIRMIIHDLKSPLSGIMGSLDYLESGMLGQISDEQRRIVSLARKSSETMLSMIQNLLDVAKMEEGKLELHKEEVDIAGLLIERKNQFEPLMKTENKLLEVEIEPDIPKLNIDKNLIERVINNLLTNALHHTFEGGRIKLMLKGLEDQVELTVSDNGVGIPPEYKDKIFEKFVQVKRKQANLRTGAGLGLTFCRMVVEAHGGSIRVESELNKGSAFIINLPLS